MLIPLILTYLIRLLHDLLIQDIFVLEWKL